MQYRALRDLALRKSPDPKSTDFEVFLEWPAGTVFTPPPHMAVETALASGKIEAVTDGG